MEEDGDMKIYMFFNSKSGCRILPMLLVAWLILRTVSGATLFSKSNQAPYFLNLHQLSFTDCKKACENRPRCTSTSFNRRTHSCELYESWIDNRKEIEATFFFEDSWRNKSKQCGEPECSPVESCDVLANTYTCIIKECTRLIDSISCHIFGNLQKIGAKAKVVCNDGYAFPDANVTKIFTCTASGNWTSKEGINQPIPFCEPEEQSASELDSRAPSYQTSYDNFDQPTTTTSAIITTTTTDTPYYWDGETDD